MKRTRHLQRVHLASLLLLLSTVGVCASARPQSNEERTAQYLQSIRHDPNRLQELLREFPKGGDLHNHLSGAIYAESFLRYATEDGLCLERKTLTLVAPPCSPADGKPPVSEVLKDEDLYNQTIDAFSMRNFHPGTQS